jgi:hypothetical protein
MAKDKRQVVQSVLGAILQPPSGESQKETQSSGLSTGRAVLLGAGLFAAGRLTAGRGGGVIGSLQDRLEGSLNGDDDEYEEPEGYEDQDEDDQEDYDEDEDEEFDDPEGEEDEDFNDGDIEDPEGYEDDDEEYDDEEEDDEDDAKPRRRRRTRSRA